MKTAVKKNAVLTGKEREALIVNYAYLVRRIAERMAARLPSSVSLDELISAGCLGLIDAVDKYDPKRNVSIKTYAAHRIKGAILDELRSMDWYSRSMRKKIREIEKAVAAVEEREERNAADWEVAEEMGIELEHYFKILSEIHDAALLNLDEHIRNHDNEILSKKTFQEQIVSKDDPSKNLALQELKQAVSNAISGLSEKEQLVVSLYYNEELTFNEIGGILNLTESRICQIHTMVLVKLRNRLKQYKQ
jgi:RNA polymerase sigma factor FliA